ncbi:uncharacterized protein LOC6600610 [Drosophila persimilis]|uniref:uncharacterized protein LOC6600610 n=1 Tax=Drosophila persimilis TaxID=7234 RepID=UPI000F0959DD|nr:uncharacterized protein LOC6600610 [Drosophila persimilis]
MECSKDINNIKYTPNISELLPEREYRCEKCGDQVFSNHSHYQLHLRQRHKVVISKQNFSVFHCPVERCRYHASAIARVEGRSFSSLRLVRQHFQKIHLAKNHKCPHCSEKFLLQRDLDRHKCLVHICNVCGLTYSSAAGLRTHMRRKNHLLDKNDGKVAIPALRTWQKLQEITVTTNENLPTIPAMPLTPESSTEAAEPEQTYAWYLPPIDVQCVLQLPQDSQREKLDMETQTEFEDPNEILVPPLRNIETQTPDDNWEQGTIAEMTMVTATATVVQETQTPEDNWYQGTLAEMTTELNSELPVQAHTAATSVGHIETQTPDDNWDQETMTMVVQETQTPDDNWDPETMIEMTQVQEQTAATSVGHIETQTPAENWDQVQQHTASTSVDDGFPSYPDNEPMFGAQTSANMYTQTCDDLFEELGLSHIQTQTHWPDDGLYNTQHTQTCDEMLDELLENFTSTYTQTRWLDWQDNEDNDR